MTAFASLVQADLSPPGWRQEQEVVAQLAGEVVTAVLLPPMVGAFRNAFESGNDLPDVEELQELVPALSDAITRLPGLMTSGLDRSNAVARRIMTASLAHFLAEQPFDFKRLAAVSKLDRELDWRYLPACFVAELAESSRWVELVLRATFSLSAKGSDDDAELLQQETTKWNKERQTEVPHWREGKLMSLGIRDFLLLGALLQMVDEPGWLRFLDKQQIPAAVETLIWQAQLEREPARVIQLLTLADVAFDATGERTQSVAAFFMLEEALSLVEKDLERRVRHDLGPDQIKAEVAAQDPLLREIVEVLGQRPDGEILLVEVAADYLVRAQTVPSDSGGMQRRSLLYQRLVDAISDRLGTAETVSGLARHRAARKERRTQWGLWLLAVNSTFMKEALDRGDAIRPLRQELWDWLVTLMLSDDSGLHARYLTLPEWVISFVGCTLAKLSTPPAMLEQTWRALTAQRLERAANRYEKDTWRLSKLVCLSGFVAARVTVQADQVGAIELWTRSMAMAITSWLSSQSGDGFSEVHLGLCHLAAGKIEANGEPARTLAYLRGEPSLLARGVIALKANGMDAVDVLQTCRAVGIDAVAYLALASNKEQISSFDEHLSEFRRAAALPST